VRRWQYYRNCALDEHEAEGDRHDQMSDYRSPLDTHNMCYMRGLPSYRRYLADVDKAKGSGDAPNVEVMITSL
jgi:hypothetical protein